MATLAGLSSPHIARVTADVATGGIEVIDRLADEWRVLCQATEFRAPFHRPEWIAAYVRAFAPRSTVVVATVRQDGRLAAVLPLIRETGLLGGLPARKLRGAGNVHTCRYDLVHRAADAEAVMAAIHTLFGIHPGARAAHATGIVAEGHFTPDPGAAELSRAQHFAGSPVRATVRFSNFAGMPHFPDNQPMADPRGMALKFSLADGRQTDVVTRSIEGFPATNA